MWLQETWSHTCSSRLWLAFHVYWIVSAACTAFISEKTGTETHFLPQIFNVESKQLPKNEEQGMWVKISIY